MMVSIMMQQLNKQRPNDYLFAMRILFAPVGIMILFWAFVPESPWFYARKGNKEAAIRSLKKLYGGVEGYDIEEEYGIIARTIEHENTNLDFKPRFRHVFQGLNLVRLSAVCAADLAETDTDRHDPRREPTVCRSRHHRHLLEL